MLRDLQNDSASARLEPAPQDGEEGPPVRNSRSFLYEDVFLRMVELSGEISEIVWLGGEGRHRNISITERND